MHSHTPSPPAEPAERRSISREAVEGQWAGRGALGEDAKPACPTRTPARTQLPEQRGLCSERRGNSGFSFFPRVSSRPYPEACVRERELDLKLEEQAGQAQRTLTPRCLPRSGLAAAQGSVVTQISRKPKEEAQDTGRRGLHRSRSSARLQDRPDPSSSPRLWCETL